MKRKNKTGSGKETNQYAVKGKGKTTNKNTDIYSELEKYNFGVVNEKVFYAIEPYWELSKIKVNHILPRSSQRARARYMEKLNFKIYNDAALEGNVFTPPEVKTILEGGLVGGKKLADENQIKDLQNAASYVMEISSNKAVRIDRKTTNKINELITATEVIEPGLFRNEGYIHSQGVVNVMGDTFYATEAGENAEKLIDVFEKGACEINKIEHPLLRGATWAAFSAYHQFYSNGNKRTGRFMMDSILMSNGFDSIVTPVTKEREYNICVAEMFRTGKLNPYIKFLVSLYDDN
jgi:Fic family protein